MLANMLTTRARGACLAAAAIVLGVLLGLVVSEIILRGLVRFEVLGTGNRFVGLLKETEGQALFRPSSDPVLAYEFVPNSRRDAVRINSAGFRGREYWREPAPGSIRIAILGDSESAGMLLPEQDTFPASLERALNQDRPWRYEVMDFSVPGYNIDQKIQTLQRALDFHPAVVILYYVFNDPLPGDMAVLYPASPFFRSYLLLLIRYAAELLRPSWYQRLHKSGDLTRFFQDLHHSELFEQCKERIRETGARLRAADTRFVVVIAPELLGYDDFKDYPHRNIHRELLGLSSPEVEVYDPLDDLAAAGRKPTELWVTPYDCHKGKLANSIIGRSVAHYLLAGGR
jgi:hypothetical protein